MKIFLELIDGLPPTNLGLCILIMLPMGDREEVKMVATVTFSDDGSVDWAANRHAEATVARGLIRPLYEGSLLFESLEAKKAEDILSAFGVWGYVFCGVPKLVELAHTGTFHSEFTGFTIRGPFPRADAFLFGNSDSWVSRQHSVPLAAVKPAS